MMTSSSGSRNGRSHRISAGGRVGNCAGSISSEGGLSERSSKLSRELVADKAEKKSDSDLNKSKYGMSEELMGVGGADDTGEVDKGKGDWKSGKN